MEEVGSVCIFELLCLLWCHYKKDIKRWKIMYIHKYIFPFYDYKGYVCVYVIGYVNIGGKL